MNQAAIDFSAPLSRKNDPQSSHDAAERAREFSASHDGIVYGVFCDHCGPSGLTARDIEYYCRLSFVQINRRLSGLGEHGLIVRRLKPDARHGKDFQARGKCSIWWTK